MFLLLQLPYRVSRCKSAPAQYKRYLYGFFVTGSNYTCDNDNEIYVNMLCDEIDDCRDNSDEDYMLCFGMYKLCITS